MSAPTAVVVGATDVADTSRFLSTFGFVEASRSRLSRRIALDLHGIDGRTPTRLLTVPGARSGLVSLVQTPHVAPASIAEMVLLSRSARLEQRITAPDGWDVVIGAPARRRSSLLDDDLYRGSHSEVVEVRWTVDDIARASTPWIQCGMVLAEPGLLTDGERDPIRVRLVEGHPHAPADVLQTGVQALWWPAPDHVRQRLADSRATADGRIVVGTLGGIRVHCPVS